MIIIGLGSSRSTARFDSMMAFGSTGIVPFLTTGGALDKEGMTTRVGTVGDVIVRRVALVTGADHILGDAFTPPAVKGEVLAQKVGLDLGFGFDISAVAGNSSLEL